MIRRASFFSIIGANGFIGSQLVSFMKERDYAFSTPVKGDMSALRGRLGHILYCAGTTSDFRVRPFDTIDAHVTLLSHILQAGNFESLTYLSSTRVYIRSESASENAPLVILPADADDIFNLSKLTGEAICRCCGRENVRAVRLSNVVGEDFQSGNFLFSLMREASETGRIILRTTLDSAKDYIHIDDVVRMIYQIALHGTQPVYNLATGKNCTNAEVVEEICQAIPAEVIVDQQAKSVRFPPIDISLIASEFGFVSPPVLPFIRKLARDYVVGSKTEKMGAPDSDPRLRDE